MPITITIAAVKAANPCAEGLDRLLEVAGEGSAEDEPIALYVPSPADVSYTLWALARVGGEEGRRLAQRFACDAAERVLPIFERQYPGDSRPRKAIEMTRAWLEGAATGQERRMTWKAASEAWKAAGEAWAAVAAAVAADAAAAAADAAAADAADAATWAAVAARVAAEAARVAAADAAQADERRWQMDRLNQMLKE